MYNQSSDSEREQTKQKSDKKYDELISSPNNWDEKLVTGNYKPSQLAKFREL